MTTTYHLRTWHSGQPLLPSEGFTDLEEARAACDALGHDDDPIGCYYTPKAYVVDQDRAVVYYPIFPKNEEETS